MQRYRLTLTAIFLSLALFFPATGRAEHIPSPFALGDLAVPGAATGFAVNGEGVGDYLGTASAVIGDINDDGYNDMAFGAPWDFLARGMVYVIFGGPGVGSTTPIESTLLNGANGFLIYGDTTDIYFGGSIAGGADFNNDGVDDFIIGADMADPAGKTNAGGAFVIYGASGIGSTGSFDLTSLNGTNGFKISGALQHDRAGGDVACGGDLNGDGFDDIALGAIQCSAQSTPLPGEVYVLFGNQGTGAGGTFELSTLAGGGGTAGFVFQGINSCDYCGGSVAFGGDINADGTDDLLVGAPAADLGPGAYTGQVYVLFGGSGVAGSGTVAASSLNGTNGYTLDGFTDHISFGADVSAAGDFNQDGTDDFLIGASSVAHEGIFLTGAAYLIYGGATVGSSGSVDVTTLDGTDGVYMPGDDGDKAGISVDLAGDVNGDGIGDIIIGAPSQWVTHDLTGRAYVVYGGAGLGGDGLFELATSAGGNGLVLNGWEIDSLAGTSVGGGDINGDGLADPLVGAPYKGPNGVKSGQGFVVFGTQWVISADFTCTPSSGTVPFSTQMSVTLKNLYAGQIRRIAGRIDVTLASGGNFPNWRAGYTNVAPGGSFLTNWTTNIPALGTVIGANSFTLVAEDVTPAPYNQPPYPAAGDTHVETCLVTGVAP